jgi:Uma2 family endonuclease
MSAAVATKPSVPTGAMSEADFKNLLLELLPQQGCWSEERYLGLTDNTNRLIEFTDGYLEVLPTPTTRHQFILRFLFLAFHEHIAPLGGTVLFAALRLRIRANKFREPDLLLLRSAQDPRLGERYWTGADLTLEVVSEDKPERDLVDKVQDYAEAGVLEYWIVSPQAEMITVLRLEGNAYVEHGIFKRGSKATSALLADFSVDVSAVLDAK